MIRKLFSGQINSITIAALLVALSSLVSRFLGIFRDRVLAGEFGAGDTLDIYYAAFRIPDLIFNLLVLGALSAGFIPIFTCLIKDPVCRLKDLFSASPNNEAWRLANNLLNILGICLIALAAIGVFAAPWLVKLLAPGFSPEKQALTAALTRVMLLSPVLLGISSVLGGILQSFKRFFVYSLSPIFYNIGIIIGALYFVPYLGIYGLAWGVVLGASFHLLVQLPAVFRLGFRYLPVIDLKCRNLRQIAVMMVPRALGLATTQINFVVMTIVASTLQSGSLAIFNFANNLQSFPIGIFGVSFAVAAFPAFSAMAFDKEKLVVNFSRVFRQVLFFIIPATILILTLRAQIIRVVLGTGQFGWEDTILTINTLGYFTISLFAQAGLPLLVRVFYARHNAKMPFYIGLLSVILNVVLAWYLAAAFGVAGLALAFSLASIFNFFLLWLILRFELGNLDEARILVSAVKFCAAAILAGLAVQGMKFVVWPYIDMSRLWGVLAQGLAAGLTGILVYLALCFLLKSEEFYDFWAAVKRRWPHKKIETGDQGEARGI